MSGSFVLWLDLAGAIVAFLLTLMVFSYVFGDNSFFRFAMHVLVGVSSGFAVVVCLYSVIWPQLIMPFWTGSIREKWLLTIPIMLSLLLVTKISGRFSGLGTPILAFLAGIGAAAAVGGSVLGTILPQAQGTINQLSIKAAESGETGAALFFFNGLIFLIGSVSTLVFFHFGVRTGTGRSSERAPWIAWIARVGRFFITVALGALFAGVFLASLAAFVDRISFLMQTVISLIT